MIPGSEGERPGPRGIPGEDRGARRLSGVSCAGHLAALLALLLPFLAVPVCGTVEEYSGYGAIRTSVELAPQLAHEIVAGHPAEAAPRWAPSLLALALALMAAVPPAAAAGAAAGALGARRARARRARRVATLAAAFLAGEVVFLLAAARAWIDPGAAPRYGWFVVLGAALGAALAGFAALRVGGQEIGPRAARADAGSPATAPGADLPACGERR